MLKRLRAQLRRPWPLRLRVTFAVTGATALVLAAAGVLVYVQFGRTLDARTDAELRDRVEALRTLAARVPATELLPDSGEPYAQVYDAAGGRLLSSTTRLGEDLLLTPEEVERAARGPIELEVEGLRRLSRGADVRAAAVSGDRVVAVAENRSRREDELRRLAALLAIVLPGTLALSAFIGYQVAGAALRPVDRIRREAQGITEGDLSARLREPGTRDELDRLTGTLNDLLARLATAVERERRIVSDAAHELRTPMTVLRTRLDVAARARARRRDAAGGDPRRAGRRRAPRPARRRPARPRPRRPGPAPAAAGAARRPGRRRGRRRPQRARRGRARARAERRRPDPRRRRRPRRPGPARPGARQRRRQRAAATAAAA